MRSFLSNLRVQLASFQPPMLPPVPGLVLPCGHGQGPPPAWPHLSALAWPLLCRSEPGLRSQPLCCHGGDPLWASSLRGECSGPSPPWPRFLWLQFPAVSRCLEANASPDMMCRHKVDSNLVVSPGPRPSPRCIASRRLVSAPITGRVSAAQEEL